MAKLPPIDVTAHWAKDSLHRGKRDEALALIDKAIKSGKARKETIALADYLKTAKRGRQPFGAKHLWWDIGIDNDEMRLAGASYDERMRVLTGRYMIDVTQVKTAVGKFEKAIASINEISSDEGC